MALSEPQSVNAIDPFRQPRGIGRWLVEGGALFLSAVMLGLIFPQPGWSGLAFVALTPAALVAARGASLMRLGLLAYLVFFAWWLWMARWLIPITGLGYLALSAFLSLYFTMALVVTRQLYRLWRLPLTLALPMGWTSLELLRGHWPAGGFGWFLLAHSQGTFQETVRAPMLIQMADLFGQWGLSFLLAMNSGLLADLLISPWRRATTDGRRRFNRRLLMLILLDAAAVMGALTYGLWRLLPDAASSGRWIGPMALVQTYVPQTNKATPSPEKTAEDWAQMVRLTQQAAAGSPRPLLVVWPETMVPLPVDADSQRYLKLKSGGPCSADYARQIRELADRHQVNLLIGASSWNWEPAGDGFVQVKGAYNSAYLIPTRQQSPDLVTRYDKLHRVPFGEFVPWVEDWPWLRERFIRWFTPYGFDYSLTAGASASPLELAMADGTIARLATPICFEDAVPDVCRQLTHDAQGNKTADLLVNLTNDGWYNLWDQPEQHLQLATLRSVELRMPMVRCVNTGPSAAIDSTGRIVSRLPGDRQGILAIAPMVTDRRATWYAYWGDGPAIVLAILTGLLTLVSFRRRGGWVGTKHSHGSGVLR